jgi:hypothetical protein
MRLKNYNEDIVLETVKIVLRDRPDIKNPTRAFMLDVAAYALNRIPPKYITSERGLTRELIQANDDGGTGEEGERLLNVIELITLVNRAVDVVVRRRRDSAPARAARRAVPPDDTDLHITYFYNMPHIFGRIVDAGDGSPVIAAQATLWINERVSVPAEPGWRNPYTTSEQTKGYFSFWPQVEMGENEAIRIEMRIAFEHGRYAPFTFRKALKVPGDFFVHDYIRGDKLMDIGTLPLQQS